MSSPLSYKKLIKVIKGPPSCCNKISDEVLKNRISSKLDDGIKIVYDDIERGQGMAVLYLMRTKDIDTKIMNPFKDDLI